MRHTARAASEFDARPSQILARVDAALRGRPTVSLCTALCLRLSGDRATLAVGGHPLPLCIGEDGVARGRRARHAARCAGADPLAGSGDLLRPGETLVAFTDGVTDAVGEDGERSGTERLTESLAAAKDAAPAALRAHLVQALDEFQVGAQADDTAVVIMRLSEQSIVRERLSRASRSGRARKRVRSELWLRHRLRSKPSPTTARRRAWSCLASSTSPPCRASNRRSTRRSRQGARTLVVDLSRLGFIDSSGLRLFIVLHQRAGAEGWRLSLIRPQKRR